LTYARALPEGAEIGRLDSLDARLDLVIEEARASLKDLQAEDGHWVFELEADATIPSEYILLKHFLAKSEDDIDRGLEAKMAAYLRACQGDHGGWSLFYRGDFNVSASVKVYYALKLAGEDPDAPHMARAREAILAHGGASRCNVFTRITLALFGQVPWRAVPVMPVEIMLLPRWFPFHLSKVSYWSRTVIAPLLILMALRPRARNPRGVGIEELFTVPPDEEIRYVVNPTGKPLGTLFLGLDKLLRATAPLFPKRSRRRAIDRAVAFVTERLNGEDGVGGIFPAMTNTVMAFDALGYSHHHPDLVAAEKSIEKLLVVGADRVYCQPCLSPVWDVGLAAHALMEAGEPRDGEAIRKAMDWLLDCQVLDVEGDWSERRPGLRPGGWAFQYRNDHYPDVDDTAVVAMALDRAGDARYRDSLARAQEWIIGMQCRNGGWGSFDADNTYHYLNHIPFADHGALLDSPTADVSARCVSMLGQMALDRAHPALRRGLAYLRKEQEPDGSWYGRWGTNYVYGTWSALCAFNAAGEDMDAPHIRKAVAWLESRQRDDGGWGEDGATYWPERRAEVKESTPSQTAWAVLALMAAGEVESDAVKRGVRYLLDAPRTDAEWVEPWFTAVGFPRVFYLRYHGYRAYFPLWALARYRNLIRGNNDAVMYGM
jgi:squalene-hopene/tetraprenyl-beta-curcumene cyclase